MSYVTIEPMTEENDNNIFAELAKVKSQPTALKIEKEEDEKLKPSLEDEIEGQLTVDVYQTKDAIVVQSTVAGVDPEDLEINITNESVTIHGSREKIERVEEKDYFYQECFWGKFSRTLVLPCRVFPDQVTASLKNGILTIILTKAEDTSKSIEIEE